MRSLADIRADVEAASLGPWAVYDANDGDGRPLWSVANDAFHNPGDDDDESPALNLIVDTGTPASSTTAGGSAGSTSRCGWPRCGCHVSHRVRCAVTTGSTENPTTSNREQENLPL